MGHDKVSNYVIVDKGICIACGSCMCWSPDVFTYDELSLAENRLDGNTGTVPIPEEVLEDVLPTLVCCPTKAIKISDAPFIDFKPTPEFGTESPDNPNITYDLNDNEITINDLSSCKCNGKNCTCKTDKSSNSCSCH